MEYCVCQLREQWHLLCVTLSFVVCDVSARPDKGLAGKALQSVPAVGTKAFEVNGYEAPDACI